MLRNEFNSGDLQRRKHLHPFETIERKENHRGARTQQKGVNLLPLSTAIILIHSNALSAFYYYYLLICFIDFSNKKTIVISKVGKTSEQTLFLF